jgi:cyclohexanone monooxygenase
MTGRGTKPSIVIIGAGPGGLCTAIKLLEAGIDDFVVFERADQVGGTWYRNRYPGLECDVRSHLYSFSFCPKKDWTQPYPRQPEILEYLKGIACRYGLSPYIQLGARVLKATWREDEAAWTIETNRGSVEASVLVSAMGMFNVIRWPEVLGLRDFDGKLMHSAEWETEYPLEGRRVGVIGSAASAVQLAPEVAKVASHLSLFQRSASWVLPKANDPFTEEEIDRFVNDPDAARLEREKIYREIDGGLTFSDPEVRKRATEAGLRAMAVVRDPETREKLMPSVPYGCHRPLVTNQFYGMFNRPNVELVTEPIERLTKKGIVTADRRERGFDVLVAATGFEVGRFLSAIEVIGRNGQRLEDAWRHGAEAYLGITTPGFPNAFMLYGPNTNNGSILTMLEYQADYIVRKIRTMREKKISWIDVRRVAADEYNRRIQEELGQVDVWQVQCHNYYRAPSGRIVTQWPNTMDTYRRRTSVQDEDAYETCYTGSAETSS